MRAVAWEADMNSCRGRAVNVLKEASVVTWEPRDSAATWHERVKREWRKGEMDSWQREQHMQR